MIFKTMRTPRLCQARRVGIWIAIGANRFGPAGCPWRSFRAVMRVLERHGLFPVSLSPLYRTPPEGAGVSGFFLNGVMEIRAFCRSAEILRRLHRLEALHRRERRGVMRDRSLDLDLLDCRGEISDAPNLILPHPRMAARLFVLLPLSDLSPFWRDVRTGAPIGRLLGRSETLRDMSRVKPLKGKPRNSQKACFSRPDGISLVFSRRRDCHGASHSRRLH